MVSAEVIHLPEVTLDFNVTSLEALDDQFLLLMNNHPFSHKCFNHPALTPHTNNKTLQLKNLSLI